MSRISMFTTPTAAQKALGTYELADLILGHLPMASLLAAQRTNTIFRGLTGRSKTIARQFSWLSIDEYANLTASAPFGKTVHFETGPGRPTNFYMLGAIVNANLTLTFVTTAPPACLTLGEPARTLRPKELATGEAESWRGVAVTRDEEFVVRFVARKGEVQTRTFPKGTTLGELFDWLCTVGGEKPAGEEEKKL